MMKHKHVFALICAAGVALASVPALPAVAAAETTVSASAETGRITDDGDLLLSDRTEDGLGWDFYNDGNVGTVESAVGKFGSFRISWKDVQHSEFSIGKISSGSDLSEKEFGLLEYRYAGTADLGDSGWFGFAVSPIPMLWYYIVEGRAENSTVIQSAGKKRGTVAVDGKKYDVYYKETADGTDSVKKEYWLIACENQYKPKANSLMKGSVPIGKLLIQGESDGLIQEDVKKSRYRLPYLFVDSGSASSGKASGCADFAYSWSDLSTAFGDMSAVRSEDGYSLDSFREYDLGTTDLSVGKKGSLDFSWKDVEYTYGLLSNSSAEIPLADMTGMVWNYFGEVDLGGYGFFGLYLMNSWREPIFLVEGWDEKCTMWHLSDDKLGEIKVGDVIYDMYKETAPNAEGYEDVAYWCFRRKNLYNGAKTAVGGEIPVLPVLQQALQLSAVPGRNDTQPVFQPDLFISSGSSDTGFVSGSASFTRNIFSYSDDYLSETGFADGYHWARLQRAYDYGTSMTAGDKGTFTAKWEDLTEWTQTLFLSGRQINTTPDHIKSLTGSYAVQGQPSEGVYYGYASTFADESGEEPVLTEVYVTKMLPNISKETSAAYIGDFESELSDRNKHYSVYLLPVTDQTSPFLAVPPQKYTKQQCWIVEEEADTAFAAGNAEQSAVDLLAMYQQVQEMGIKLNKLTDTSFFVFAAKGSGDCQLRKNEILFETDGLTVPVQTPTVKGDANCDGVLDVSDAVLTARVLVEDIEAEISQQGLVNADTDGSGKLETNDLTRMLQAIAKKIKL